jgi:hypothetical protein
MRSLWLPGSLLAVLLLLLGCSDTSTQFWGGEPEDPDGDGDPWDDDDDGDPGGPGAGPGGFLNIGYWDEVPAAGESIYGGAAGFNAQFSDEITQGIPETGGVKFRSAGAPDTCAFTVWDAADTATEGGVPGESQPLHAGVLTLSSPTWSVEMEVDWEGGHFQYTTEFDLDWQIHFETYYEVSATGGTFPAFHSTEELLVPDPIHLLEPDPDVGFDVTDEDFTIEWVGGSAEELHLEFHNGGDHEYGNVGVHCRPLNDGSFTIPGHIVGLFGNEDSIQLMLSQPRNVDFEVGNFVIDMGSAASTTASGTAW